MAAKKRAVTEKNSDDISQLIGNIFDCRLTQETATLLVTKEERSEFKTKTSVNASVTVGIAAEEADSERNILRLECNYGVNLSSAEDNEPVLEYVSQHVAHFRLSRAIDSPSRALTESAVHPFETMITWIARERAQATVLAMGAKGIDLPFPREFGSGTRLAAADTTVKAPVSAAIENSLAPLDKPKLARKRLASS